MIQKLRIERYKSIRELELSCKRINIFVGAPDTGKTNILEALGLWCPQFWREFSLWTRVEQASQLFFDLDLEHPIEVRCDDWSLQISHDKQHAQQCLAAIYLKGGSADSADQRMGFPNQLDHVSAIWPDRPPIPIKFYSIDRRAKFSSNALGSFEPVTGNNLPALLLSSKSLRQEVSQLAPEGFQIQVTPHENRIAISRDADGVLVSHPYSALSETMRRIIFHTLVFETNKDCTIVLDEPEAHTFPVYTKLLAEKMARYCPSLQFFLTTHSPFMLLSLIENTPANDLNVIYCRMENFETKAYPLNENQVSRVLGWEMDSFFNFDRLIEDE
jgi:AAA ATPase domain